VLIQGMATMSNYLWTEDQIQAAIVKGEARVHEVWLGTNIFRIGNRRDANKKRAKSSDYRKLMAILVERNHAYPNVDDHENPIYKICFNWENRSHIINGLEESSRKYFSPGILFCSVMTDLPPKDLFNESDTVNYLGRQLTVSDSVQFFAERLRWEILVEVLRGFQDSGKFRISDKYDNVLDDDWKKIFLRTSIEVACMYKAFEIGWSEIQCYFPNTSNYDDAFATVLYIRSYTELLDNCCLPNTAIKPYSDIKRMKSIASILPSVNSYLQEKSPDVPLENPLKIFGEDYGAGLDAVNDAHKAIESMKSKSPHSMIWAEDTTRLKHALLQSSDPKVKQAALKWEEAIQKEFLHGMQIIRRAIDRETAARKVKKSNKSE
jgi:hypothetical protein